MLMQQQAALGTRRKFDPRQIAGLGLWLDASDPSTITIATGVSQWNDKSGNGRNFAQATGGNQPAQISAGQNGMNTIRADGVNDVLAVTSGTDLFQNLSGASIYTVRRFVTLPATNKAFFFASVNGNASVTRAGMGGGNPTANRPSIFGRRLDADSNQIVQAAVDASTAFQLHSAEFDWGNSDAYNYVAGAVDGSSTSFQTSGNTSNTSSLVIELFAVATGSNFMNAELAEVVCAQRLHSTVERQQYEGYLSHKWGLASALPSAHPYRYVAP